MFNSTGPSDAEYYDGDTAYAKTVLRQAMRHDVHPYEILSARMVVDLSELLAFAKQDERVRGRHEERAERRFHRAGNELRELYSIVDEGVTSEDRVDGIAELLIEDDKR